MLVDAYTSPHAPVVLYQLLKERPAEINISHRKMPTWDEHVAFFNSRPYQAWYLIEVDNVAVGAIYLTKPAGPSRAGDEIGVFLFEGARRRGYAKQAVMTLMERHGQRRYLANIAPSNAASTALFEGLGFRHIQNTYEFRG